MSCGAVLCCSVSGRQGIQTPFLRGQTEHTPWKKVSIACVPALHESLRNPQSSNAADVVHRHRCIKRKKTRGFILRSASATTAATAVTVTWVQHAPAISQLITSAGIFVICVAASIFLLASIPTLWSMARVAVRTDAVLKIVEQELPESAALLRLSGLEMTEAISELSGLGSELSNGIRSTAKLATITEQSVRQGIAGVQQGIVPLMAKGEQAARSTLEAELQARARLGHTKQLLTGVSQAAGATTSAVRQARFGLQLVGLMGAAVGAGAALRQRMQAAAIQNLRAQ